MAPAEAAGNRWVAMESSRLELNLVRLLCRCETMAAEKRDPDEWRLEKYVEALENMLQALKAQASKPASEVINEYSRKVDFLKGMLQAEKLTSSSEKALANQFLAPGRMPTTARERVPATKTVHLQSRARYTSEMRRELLGMTLSHSLKMADQNLEKLKTESERLEQHTQKAVNWLLWAMLIIVCFIFISMIIFIRIMPKLK
ncbi:hypothetical protein MC885_018188 [Smutsia gigantea]|nr:hypothetical protein MC885_018188 [Smutsia gigantea]